MVTTAITITKNELLKDEDYAKVDSFIDELIAKHSNNSEMMNLMALEASSLSTSVESRSKELESQGFLRRTWNDLTGSNHRVSARNQRDLAQSQYLGQQMLNKLAENNLMTYQMVVAIGDKLNRVATDANDTRLEVAKINQTLANFFINIRQKLEQKFSALDRNDDLLFWKETMMYEQIYKGKTYEELTRPQKVLCLANEFYHHSKQEWSSRDLSFLRSIIVQVGHQPTETMQLKEVFQSYQEDNDLLKQLFLGIEEEPQLSKSTEMTPTLMAFNKLKAFENEESNIVDTIEEFSPSTSKDEASLVLTTKFIENQCGRDLNHEITFFDTVMNLVEDLTLCKLLKKAENTKIEQELLEKQLQEEEKTKKEDRIQDIEVLIENAIVAETVELKIEDCHRWFSFLEGSIENWQSRCEEGDKTNQTPENINIAYSEATFQLEGKFIPKSEWKKGSDGRIQQVYFDESTIAGTFIEKGELLGILTVQRDFERYIEVYSPMAGFLVKRHFGNSQHDESNIAKDDSICISISPVRPSKELTNFVKCVLE